MPEFGAVQAIDETRAPNSLGRRLLGAQFSALPGQQNAAVTGLAAQAKQALAGYGGYKWDGADLSYDGSKGLGEKEKGAYKGAAYNANSAGMLESSFANQNIASAVQRMSLEGQAIATQYASALNQTYTDYANRASSIASDWAGLYGADSQWLVANPPPKPPDWMAAAGTVGDVWAGYHDPDPAGLASMYTGMDFNYRTDPDGRVVVSATPKPQAAPAPQPTGAAAAPPGPSTWTPNAAGNIVTNIRMSDLTPHSASLLAAQYPGYRLVRSGSGVAVLQRI
jgi:hypothetical protein